jgi:MYXO-CTERM domain-containing protein
MGNGPRDVRRRGAAWLAGIVLALVGSAAQALPAVQVEFRLNYYPPNPCIDLGVPSLDGLLTLYIDGTALSPGASASLACSDDGSGATVAIRFGAPMSGLLGFAFYGLLTDADSEGIAVAAAPDLAEDPPTALSLGRFADGVFAPGDASEWLLVAYPGSASPVTIGDIVANVNAVPEPGSGLVVLGALAALAAIRRRR